MADTEQKVLNRWMVVVGAILIQLCLGAIYAWSAFTGKLTEVGGDYEFTAKQTQAIFSAGLAAFAIIMAFIGGPWQKKSGPKIVAITGGIVLGLGYILGAFLGSSFWAQFICIGLIGGAGIGLAYVVPIAVAAKWFPDKKGMIMGLAVAGFGFGATIWVKLAGAWGHLLDMSLMGLPGVQSVFLIYGIAFLIIVLIGSIWMVNPPEGWLPAGYTPPVPKKDAVADAKGAVEFNVKEMWATPQFYMLWLTFIFSAGTGLMVIGCIKLFGIDALQASAGLTAEAAAAAAGTAMAWYAILNGLGRIVWGTASDKLGRKMSIFLMCLFQGIIMLAFLKLGGTVAGLTIGACIIGFNFGGNFALFPAATADFFGNKNVGTNYGWMFTAYGVGGIVMPMIAGYFKDKAGGTGDPAAWSAPFLIGGVVCILAAIISILAKPPQKKITGETASE